MRNRTVVAVLMLVLVPSVALAVPVITEYVEINKPASDPGKLSLEDKGTDFTGITTGSISNWFRLIRADGAGYISNNASFTGSSSGGYWTQDNSNGMSIVQEFGEGNWGVFLAPKNSPNPIGSSLQTVLNAEFMGGDNVSGPMVVQVPYDRLFLGKTRSEVLSSSADAALRVITRSTVRPLYVRGQTSTLANFASSAAGSKALVIVGDGPDENNAGYLAVGIDPTGSQVGYGSGGSFVSTGKNGTGTARNLVLHTYNTTDVVIAAGNSETAVFKASGRVGIGTSTPDMTLSVNGDADKPGGGSWRYYSDERLKNIHGTFDAGLDAVMQLRPVRYEYKQNNALGLVSNGEEYIGFSAQAVERAIPEAVTRNAAGYLMVNNDPILWAMLNAIQEQQRENQQLRARVEKLELKIKARER